MMRKLTCLAMLIALAACNKDKTTTVTTSDGKEIKITSDSSSSESGTITFEGKDGEGKGTITYGDAASKQGLPLGMPVYPGGQVKGAFMGSGDSGESGGMATVMTKDAPAKAVAYYKVEAEKRGYAVKTQSTNTTEKGETVSFTAKGKDDSSLVVTATPNEDGGTAVVIIGGSK